MQAIKLSATAEVWSFDCYTQSCRIKLGDAVLDFEITSEEGFVTKETEFLGEPEYLYSNFEFPVEIEFPYTINIPERSL